MLRRLLTAFGLLAFALAATAQTAYPTRPLTLIVPFPPGGVADITARIQYLDAPQFQSFWDADAKKLADVLNRIGKVE